MPIRLPSCGPSRLWIGGISKHSVLGIMATLADVNEQADIREGPPRHGSYRCTGPPRRRRRRRFSADDGPTFSGGWRYWKRAVVNDVGINNVDTRTGTMIIYLDLIYLDDVRCSCNRAHMRFINSDISILCENLSAKTGLYGLTRSGTTLNTWITCQT